MRCIDKLIALAAGLCAAASINCWAFLGSGFRLITPTAYELTVNLTLGNPATRPALIEQLTRDGHLSLMQARALASPGGAVRNSVFEAVG